MNYKQKCLDKIPRDKTLEEGCVLALGNKIEGLGPLIVKLIEPYKPDKTGKQWLCTNHNLLENKLITL